MKKYIDAQLQVVQIKKSDIVTASEMLTIDDVVTNIWGNAAGRRYDEWYEGY